MQEGLSYAIHAFNKTAKRHQQRTVRMMHCSHVLPGRSTCWAVASTPEEYLPRTVYCLCSQVRRGPKPFLRHLFQDCRVRWGTGIINWTAEENRRVLNLVTSCDMKMTLSLIFRHHLSSSRPSHCLQRRKSETKKFESLCKVFRQVSISDCDSSVQC